MNRAIAPGAMLATLLVGACGSATTAPAAEPGAATSSAVPTAAAAPSPPARMAEDGPPHGYTDGSGINEGYPALAPARLTPEVERTETGARNVLMAFARALELKEFDQAWSLLGPDDRRKWPKADFTRRFADLGRITVEIPGGTMEGACGVSYYTAPITITANDREGRPVRHEGTAVLRRVNDVAGASPEHRSWRFDRLTLDQTH